MIEFLILTEAVTIILLFISAVVVAALALVIATLLVLDKALVGVVKLLEFGIDKWGR